MTTTEVSRLIEKKVAERARLAKRIWGAPSHIAVVVEPKLAEINREIQDLQMGLWQQGQK